MSMVDILVKRMMRIEITPEALAQAEKLSEPIYSRVLRIVERLER